MATKNAHTGDDADSIGGRIRRRMKEKGLSQSDLARATGIERTDVNRIVNDRRKPRSDQLTWIAKALDIPEAQLLGDALPPELDRARAELAKFAERILESETNRAAALRAAEDALARLDEERVAFAAEREELVALGERERQKRLDREKKLDDARALHEKAERASRANVEALEQKLRESSAKNAFLELTTAALRRSLAKEQAAKVDVGALAGFAGLFAGALLTDGGGRRRRA